MIGQLHSCDNQVENRINRVQNTIHQTLLSFYFKTSYNVFKCVYNFINFLLWWEFLFCMFKYFLNSGNILFLFNSLCFSSEILWFLCCHQLLCFCLLFLPLLFYVITSTTILADSFQFSTIILILVSAAKILFLLPSYSL